MIPTDCKDFHDIGKTTDGEYTLSDGSSVCCDMTNGGWTVIQRRVDDSVDFERMWADYVAGFGSPSGNYWAGINKIHALTSDSTTELYVFMDTFEGESAWARYSSFSVGDAASNYMMTVSGYSGTAGDAMAFQNGMQFTKIDNDNDADSTRNCAVVFRGGWWYKNCHNTNPYGLYLHGANSIHGEGVTWAPYKGQGYSLKTMEMKIRRV